MSFFLFSLLVFLGCGLILCAIQKDSSQETIISLMGMLVSHSSNKPSTQITLTLIRSK